MSPLYRRAIATRQAPPPEHEAKTAMAAEAAKPGEPAAGAVGAPGLPAITDRATFQAELDRLRARQKAHTREGDAIAAGLRRLPTVEVAAGHTAGTGREGQRDYGQPTAHARTR